MADKLINAGDPTSEDFPEGPRVGEPIPEFTLPDQHGNVIHYKPDGVHKGLILFHRSASW
jgi:hypothetical protein